MVVTGVDYLTGETEIPVNDLRVLTGEEEQTEAAERSDIFPGEAVDFARFAGFFAYKYGVANRMRPPVVLKPESVEAIRAHYEEVGGRINEPETDRAEL